MSATNANILYSESEYQYLYSEYKGIKELYKGKAAGKYSLDEIEVIYKISKQEVMTLKENYKS